MNFTYDGAKEEEIIKNYVRSGNYYQIEYLDGNVVTYVSFDENEEDNLKNQMLKQAQEREEKTDIKDDRLIRAGGLILAGISCLGVAVYMAKKYPELAVISSATAVWGFSLASCNKEKLKELKKYKMFLEMVKNVPEHQLDNSWTELSSVDKIYQIPVMNINTIDNFEYSDVKQIYKKFKSNKKNN